MKPAPCADENSGGGACHAKADDEQPSGLPVLSTRVRLATETITLDEALADVSSASEKSVTPDRPSGQLYASSQALAFEQSATQNRVLGNRLDRVVHGEAEPGAWVDVHGARGRLRQSGYATADTSLWGGQAGADTRLSERVIVGASVNWGEARARVDRQAGRSRSNSLGATLYGRYGEERGVYAMGRVGISRIDSTVQRDVHLAGINSFEGKRDDQMRSMYAELGYGFDLSQAMRITPFTGLAFDQLKRGRFSESDHALALHATSRRFDKTSLIAGLRASTVVQWFGGETSLYTYGLYQHLLSSRSLDFTATYASAPGTDIAVRGIGLQRHTGWVGLGGFTRATERVSWNLSLDLQMGQGGLTNKVASAGMRVAF